MIFETERLAATRDENRQETRYKVLVVDDEPANLRVMINPLSRAYEVLSAESAEAALELIPRHRDIAMIISDQRMPGKSGVELLQACREMVPRAVGIIVTGYVDIESVIQAINDAQIYKFILKPIDRNDLLRTVARGIQEYEHRHQQDRLIEDLRAQVDDHVEELEQVNQASERHRWTDPGTGLLNRRFMDHNLGREQALVVRRFARQAANDHRPDTGGMQFLLVALEDYTSLCEKHGEEAGMVLVNKTATALSEVIRPWDFLARWTDSAFMVVARDINAEEAADMAGQIGDTVAGIQLVIYGESMTNHRYSIGYACYPLYGSDPEAFQWADVVKLASSCLNAAHRSGDNIWVGVGPAAGDLDHELPSGDLPDPETLVSQGHLQLKTSLPDARTVNWA